VRNPFTSREREFLRSFSGFAEDGGLLNRYHRKVLYEGGKSNYVFVNKPSKINDALDRYGLLASPFRNPTLLSIIPSSTFFFVG
jgi:hypothetical protein